MKRILAFPIDDNYLISLWSPLRNTKSFFRITFFNFSLEICLYKGSFIAHMVFNKVNWTFIYVSWSQAAWQSNCWRWLQWSKMPLIKTYQVRIWCQSKYCSVARFSASRLKLERTESNRMEKQDGKMLQYLFNLFRLFILKTIKM